MPFKQGYTISDEISPHDEEVVWPDGHRCCVAITIDLSVASGPAGITEKDLTSWRARFGLRDGLDHLLAALRRFGLRATFAVPAVMARVHGTLLRDLAVEGHEVAAQGLRHEDVTDLPRAEEAERIARTLDIVGDTVGIRPRGWYSLPRPGDPFAGGTISPNTMDLLLEAGLEWFGNGLADDVPHYWVTDAAARKAILTLPYYYHYDDQFFLLFPSRGTGLEHADSLYRNWVAEFAAQYRRGRYFHMTLHPHAIGFGHRIRLLETFLTHMVSHVGLWNATSSKIAQHWRQLCPAEDYPQLEASIWKDYPGSLS